MSRPNNSSLPSYNAAPEDDGRVAIEMHKAGAYLKELRRQRGLTQSDLAEAVEAGRGTIDRIEAGAEEVNIRTVLRVLKVLGASPWHYYDLATNPRRTPQEVWHQQAVLRGILAYVQVLTERKHIPPAVLAEVTRSVFPTSEEGEGTSVPELALLLALIYLDVPLVDLAPITRASQGHEEIGRQQAEARSTFLAHVESGVSHEPRERHSIPSLDAVLYRLAGILRYGQDLPTVLKHELSHIEADLKRYRVFLVLANGYINAEP